MATSSSEIRNKNDKLRHEILSYKPGKSVPHDDERVVFPDKLVIGMIYPYGCAPDTVPAMRRALHGDVEPSKIADKCETSTEDQEEYLTDYISVIIKSRFDRWLDFEEAAQDLTGKVGCQVLLVNPKDFPFFPNVIEKIKKITRRVPLCAIRSTGRREAIEKAKTDLNHLGITDIYELDLHNHILSDEDQLQWLDLLHGCLQEGDRALAINELKKICTNPRCRLLYEKTNKEAKEANQKMFKEVEERKHQIQELERKCEESLASHESLVNDNARLKKGREEDRERAEKEKLSLTADMTKELESKLEHVDTLTNIVGEKERNEMTLRQQVEELKKGSEEDRATAEKEKRSLAADMMKELESKQKQVDTLTEIVGGKERNETTLCQQVEELRKGKERDKARFEKDKRSLELGWKKEHDYNEQLLEQLERETWKLRTKIQLESEIRSAERKKKAEIHQWSFMRWMTPGKQVHGDTSRGEVYPSERINAPKAEAEPPNDEFANILKQIADDLSDEGKIDSLGSQLGILQGDIARALKTNMRYEQVTSRGTHLMLKQWREGVSREDERIEIRRALEAAKLLELADHYFPQGELYGLEQPQKMKDYHQLLGIDSTPSVQGSSGGQTKTRETTAVTDQSRLHGQSFKNQENEPNECIDQFSEEVSSHCIDGVHGTPGAGLEDSQEVVEAQWSSGEVTNTQTTRSTTDQPPQEEKSSKNPREEISEDRDQHSEESSINNDADDVQETPVDVSSNEPFHEGTDTSDKSDVEYITIYCSELLSNLALTETSSEKLLILLFMKVIIDVPLKIFGG